MFTFLVVIKHLSQKFLLIRHSLDVGLVALVLYIPVIGYVSPNIVMLLKLVVFVVVVVKWWWYSGGGIGVVVVE